VYRQGNFNNKVILMRTFLFVVISLISGIIAGEALAAMNLFVVEPSTDKAIGFEVQRDIANGNIVNFRVSVI
jgi:hypothetical protein